MQKDFSIADLWLVFKKVWWKMLLIMLPIMLITGVYTQKFIPKKYSSTGNFLIQNISASSDTASVSLLSAADYLANDYVSIIKGDKVMGVVSEALKEKGIDYTPDQLRGMISTATKTQSSEFSVTISNTNPEHAYEIATLIYEKAPDIITVTAKPYAELFDEKKGVLVTGLTQEGKEETVWVESMSCVAQLRAPVLDTVADSPNLLRNVLLAGVITGVLAYVFFFLRKLFDTVIHHEDDLADCVDVPLLGVIPGWNSAPTNKRYEKGGDSK